MWPTCSGVQGQAPEIRDTEEKKRDRELAHSSLWTPPSLPHPPLNLSLWVTKAGRGSRRPPLHMSVRSMIDRAEIPAHRLLQSHHSNEPEREMDRWMKGKKRWKKTQWIGLYLQGRTRKTKERRRKSRKRIKATGRNLWMEMRTRHWERSGREKKEVCCFAELCRLT